MDRVHRKAFRSTPQSPHRGLASSPATRCSECASTTTVRATSPISQRLQLQGGFTFLPTHSLSLRVGGTALFGRRTTTIASGFEWEACNLTDRGCEFAGSPYSGGESLVAVKLPAYFRADFSARQRWSFMMGGRQMEMAVFGTFSNLLGGPTCSPTPGTPPPGGRLRSKCGPFSLVLGLDWRF